MNPSAEPKWMKWVLMAAAAYNIVWGLLAVLFPLLPFQMARMPVPNYPELWQCIGMIVGVYGLGYAIASSQPYRHWPIVLVGLVGKLLGSLGFLNAALHGRLPWRAGWVSLTNDVIWITPFVLILVGAHEFYLGGKRSASPELLRFALRAKTNRGVPIDELSRLDPLLIVFLRHAGCTFCREALSDIAKQRRQIERAGGRVVLIHMGSDEHAEKFFARYGLSDVHRVSDPQKSLYRAFGLGRGTLNMLFGPRVWLRGLDAAILRRHWIGGQVGDGFQMPGVFVVYHNELIRSYRHQSVADRPDYAGLIASDSTPGVQMHS